MTVNNRVSVTPALPADATAVIALWERCGLTRPWNDPQSDFDRALVQPSSTILLVRDEETITGSVMVGDDGHRGWVYYLAVDPAQRRSGLGRTLMAAAETWLKARGCPKIQFMVRTDNAQALGFYDQLGYAPQDVATLGRFLKD